MTGRRSLLMVIVGRDSLRKDGLTQFLRSAGVGVVISVLSADALCASRLQHRQLLFFIVHDGHDFESAVEQIEPVRIRHPGGRVIMIGDQYRLRELTTTFRAGANGYFVDATTPDVFMKSIELVMMGETVYPPALLPGALHPASEYEGDASPPNGHDGLTTTPNEGITPKLSPREQSILRCLVEGDSNKTIARTIDIAEGTVKVHIKAILRKLGVQNRTQAAIWGMNNRSVPSRCLSSQPAPARQEADALLSVAAVKGLEKQACHGSRWDPDPASILLWSQHPNVGE